MKKRIVALLSLLAAVAAAYQTENVFVVVIDGMRWQDGPAGGNALMPFLADSLIPRGTLYTDFRNSGITITNSANSTILTGARQVLLNNYYITTPIRPREPTLGEYFRKELGLPASKAAYISGKDEIWNHPVSTCPGYGYGWAPTVVLTPSVDTITWDSTQAVMRRDHPRLCYVLLGEVDWAGHSGARSWYLSSIRHADSLVWQLWQQIQSDSIYRNRTTMFVTDDHGRHDDAHGGWYSHGGWCRGCRHVLFLAVGPDIRRGAVITRTRDQVDIAPTIAELLGFSAGLAQGTVMDEMITDYEPRQAPPETGNRPGEKSLSGRNGRFGLPDVVVNPQGIHVVYASDDPARAEVRYTRSSDRGETWLHPAAIIPAARGLFRPQPVIVADGDSGLVVAASGYANVLSDTTTRWFVDVARSPNSGGTWELTPSLDTAGSISCRPALAAGVGRVGLVSAHAWDVTCHVSLDGGQSFGESAVVSAPGNHYPQAPSVTTLDTSFVAVWQDIIPPRAYHDVWLNAEPWSCLATQVTHNGTHNYSYDPSITEDRTGNLHLVCATLFGDTGDNSWRIEYRRSTNRGLCWTDGVCIAPGRVVARPQLRCSDNGRLHAAWADYADGGWRIATCHSSDDGTTWSQPELLSRLSPFSLDPRFAVQGDTLFVTWQDLRAGSGEIFFLRHIVPSDSILPGGGQQSGPGSRPLPEIRVSQSPVRVPVSIRFSIRGGSRTPPVLDVWSAAGRLVRSLQLSRAWSQVVTGSFLWDGCDESGRSLPAGVYSCALRGATPLSSQRIVLIR